MAGVKLKIRTLGLTKLKRKLERAPVELRKDLAGLMQSGGETLADEVKRQIANGPKTGRWYTRAKVRYRASASGEAPAYATGSLFRTIRVKTTTATKPGARVIADGVYRLMEFGTRLMAARPAFLPAFQRLKRPIADKVEHGSKAAFAKALKKSG